MNIVSRTNKSILNAKVALIFYFINLVLQFFSRKIFLDYLGSEVLGLNTTAQNLLGFLNLAELGIGSAVAYNLYKPLYEKNEQAINDIVSIQGWLYRKIAIFVLIGAGVLMLFFPIIFAKAKVPLWYTYGSFIVLLISALLSYFINYKQIVLSADQKEYKITFNVQGIKATKVVFQIIAIIYLKNGYVYWMLLELMMSVITSFQLDKTVKNEYPWLKPLLSKGSELRFYYPDIIRKTKQLFFHKIGSFVLTQTSPIIIYGYASLTVVAIYGNYMLIVVGVTSLVGALLNSISAGVGNLVAEGNKERIKSVFWELTSLRIWIASIICFGIYSLGHSFITLWVGKEYLLPNSTFIVLIIITFITLTRTNDAFLAAYGLYQDVFAPILEAILNLSLSLLLGYYYGLTGILTGVAISLMVVVVGWKPYFLYRYGFKTSILEYVFRQLKYVSLLVGVFFLSEWIIGHIIEKISICTYWDWLRYGCVVMCIYGVLSFVAFYVTDKGIRDFVFRTKKIILNCN